MVIQKINDDIRVVNSGLTLWRNSRRIISAKSIKHLVRYGVYKFAILGSSGTGKTILGSYLSSENPNRSCKYSQSSSNRIETFICDYVARIIITPGLKIARTRNLNEVYRDVASGKIRGLIYVVSYGYHSLQSIDIEETKYFDKYEDGFEKKKQLFIDNYTQACRQDELDLLREVANYVKVSKSKFWMITLIAKEDLWGDEKKEVELHYEGDEEIKSEYRKCIDDISSSLGNQNFIHYYVYASLASCNFLKYNGSPLAKTIEGYDDEKRKSAFAYLRNMIIELIA